MKLIKLTDPFTGAPLEAVRMEDHLIFDRPLKAEKLVCHIVEKDYVKLPLKCFEYVELMDGKEAAMELHVSRQRMVQLVEANILKPVYLGKTQYFSRADVLEYKKSRKPGRPKKA